MKLRMKIDDFHYGDAAVKLFPRVLPKLSAKLPQDGAAARILAAAAYIPEDVLYDICDSIPLEEKNRVVMSLTAENKDRILCLLEKEVGQKLGIRVSDLTMDEELNIMIQVDNIDLMILADQVLPRLEDFSGDGLAGKILPMLSKMPRKLWAGLLSRVSSEELMNTGIYMLSHSGNMVPDQLTRLMNDHGIRGRIASLGAEA